MTRSRTPATALAGLVLGVLITGAYAADLPDEPALTAELASIREQVVALDLEGALGTIERFLGRPGLPDDVRAEALALRAGAHVAEGDLDAAEADYREILPLQPAFHPDPALASRKSLERLARLQASMIGTVHLDLDPPDARLLVDDRPVAAAEGVLKLLAGERRLRAERAGFDPIEVTVRAVAGQETLVDLRLVPNARGIVVRTDIAGVDVLIDGVKAGETSPAGAEGPAMLLVPDLPIGEHGIRLEKPCFATETISAFVTVDLADRAAKPLAIVTMRPAAAQVIARGADYPGELRVDGARVAGLPVASFTVCPGRRMIEVVASGRVVWSGVIEAEENERELDLAPRPNAVLLGDEWPADWAEFAAAVSRHGRLDRADDRDLATREGWRGVAFPRDTDLGVAVRAGTLPGETARVWVYGPAMDAASPAAAPPAMMRPTWIGGAIGAGFVEHAGAVLVATVAPGDVAARAGLAPGVRLAGVGGGDVEDVASARSRFDAIPPGSEVTLRLVTPAGEAREVPVVVRADPRVVVPGDAAAVIVRGAWAAAEGAAGTPSSASALANLAVLLERGGRRAEAVDVWRRAKALDPASFGLRADYASAAHLAAQGRSVEAAALFRRVREAAEAAGDLVLGAAAADYLTDLGVAR